MSIPCRAACTLAFGLAAMTALAQPIPPGREALPLDPPPAPQAKASKWEGAIGPIVSYSPAYSGSSDRNVSLSAGFYLRYGRVSISNASGFVTRRNKDDIFRGLGIDLSHSERTRVHLSLRLDHGRQSDERDGLEGMHDVRRTLRGRASVSRQIDEHWKLGLGWNADLLGRDGGNIFDVGASREARWSERITWSVGGGLSWADRRNLRNYYGVTAEDSANTGRPVYEPGAGLREASLGTGWRMEINERWMLSWGGSVSRLLGPAADSPLTTSPHQWGLNAALAWRF